MRKVLSLGIVFSLGVVWLASGQGTTAGPRLDLRPLVATSPLVAQGEDKKKGEEKKKKAAAEEKEDKGPFKHLKYRAIGPAAGGRVSASCGVPGDPSTYYIAAAAGGVWKTTDGGLNWKSVFDDEAASSMGAIALAPSDANVVYAGSGEANIRGNVEPGNGIYKSTNGGKSWKHVWKQKGQIGRIVVHPTNSAVAYAAVLGSAFGANPERGVYRTRDGGDHWELVLKKDADTGAIDVCFDPGNPRILFAALWQVRRTPWSLSSGGPGSGIYRSEDGGDTWKKVGPKTAAEREADEEDDEDALPDGPWGRAAIAIAPSDSRRVYALIEAEKGGLYRSDDGGAKWKLVNAGRFLRQRAWYFTTITVDPANADVVWCPNVRLLHSIDGGKTFKNFKGPHHPDHHDLWIDPKNPRRIIDSNDGGVDISTNGGASWFAPPLPVCQFYHVRADNRVPYHVMGTMQDQGTASGPSNSLSSAGISLSDWHSVGGGETGFAVPDPADPNIVYAGEYGGYISRYDHRTRQAANISAYPINPSGKGAGELRYRFQWTAPILVSPHDPRTLYHAANVLFRTRDGGTTWEKISGDLTRDDKSKEKWSGGPITGDNTGAEYYCTIFAIAESPKQAGVLWAGSDDGLVHVSKDGGKSWENVTAQITGLPAWGTVTCIEPSPHDAGTAYVVVDAHRMDDDRPFLWKTSDFGKTWTSIAKGLDTDAFLRVVREDPNVPGLLYVGTAHRVMVSWDAGKHWASLKLNMPTVLISDLVVKGDDLVVGTNGRSLWIFDGLTPIRRWTPKANEVGLLPVQPATRWRYHGENYAGEDRIAGDNPAKGALLYYDLAKKPKDDLVLEVFDADGTRVRRLTNKKPEPEQPKDAPDAPWSVYKPTVLPDEPGLQRVAWDLQRDGPKFIPKAKNDAGTPHEGPLVPPGKYTLKLHVDGKVFDGTVAVRPDPRVKLAPEVLKERYRLTMQVHADISALSETVIALRAVRRQIVGRSEALKDAADAKAHTWIEDAKKVVARLDALEEQLHNPKAEVAYDILAMKGGAKLYSQLVPLYNTLMESDGPVTQGIREVYAEHSRELQRLESEWQALLTGELARLNDAAPTLPLIIVPGAPPKKR